MSSRSRVKLERSMWSGGFRRRSPRISALDVWRRKPDSGSARKLKKKEKETSSRTMTTRDRNKRKRHQVHPVKEVSDDEQVEDGKLQKDESISCGKESRMPEKQVLEHILDTLQRRDTYEIFAEPVDPDEVADYYEIINEPMDFGTMRAKLHEGMYESLEQFKHDVLLITNNAMHFNSSSTIYFRQARTIHELSKRVFHVLETDPDKFESEFLGTRRRSARRAQVEAKDGRHSADVKSSSLTTNISSKKLPCSVATTIPERNSNGTPKSATVTSLSNRRKKDNFFLSARDGRGSNKVETDRRCTYRPQRCYFDNNYRFFEPKLFNSEPLLTIEKGLSYRESLSLFVKDLGPTARMIATRKIQRLQETPCQIAGSNNWLQARNYQEPAACAPSLSASHSLDAFRSTLSFKFTDSVCGLHSLLGTTAKTVEVKKAEEKEEANIKGRSSCDVASGKKTLDYGEESSLPARKNVPNAPRRRRAVEKQKNTDISLGASSCDAANARDLDSSINKTSTNTKSTPLMVESGKFDDNVRPVILALERSNANSSEQKYRNKKSCTSSTWFSQSRGSTSHVKGSRRSLSTSNQTTRATEEKNGGSSPLEASQSLPKQPIRTPVPTPISGFPFDMQFLKAKLNQMKVAGQDRELNKQNQARYQTSLMEHRSFGYMASRLSETNQQSFSNNQSLDALNTKLALQL